MANYLDRAAIIAAQDLGYQDVDVPEWGGTVRVYALSATQNDKLHLQVLDMSESMKASALNGKNGGDFEIKLDMDKWAESKAQVVVWTVADGDGNRLFTQKDIGTVGLKSGEVIDRLYDVAIELSGATALSMNAISKNSGTGPSAGSASA